MIDYMVTKHENTNKYVHVDQMSRITIVEL